jgi:hypothetical protein
VHGAVLREEMRAVPPICSADRGCLWRPRRTDLEHRRTALVAVRLLPQERDVLAKTARSRGITLSEFIRTSAMQSASAPATEVEARLPLGALQSS